jgi:hypothetical protein
MPKKQWSELDPRVRRLIIVGGSVDASLRLAALVVVNSAGVLPVVYFLRGRRGPL